MLRPLNPPKAASLGCADAPCPRCQHAQASGLGFVMPGGNQLTAALGDWKMWALIGLGAIALYLLFQSTPKQQAKAVARRRARKRYRAELERIREGKGLTV